MTPSYGVRHMHGVMRSVAGVTWGVGDLVRRWHDVDLQRPDMALDGGLPQDVWMVVQDLGLAQHGGTINWGEPLQKSQLYRLRRLRDGREISYFGYELTDVER